MAKPRESRDDALSRYIMMFKRHVGSCRQCTTAKRTRDYMLVCETAMKLSLSIAFSLDDMVKLRRKALTSCEPYVFACPDTSKHGKSYSLIAQPMAVIGIQGTLI